jgi:hypothetical protein
MSEQERKPPSFHVIDNDGGREVSREEFLAEIERIENAPRPRYEHAAEEREAGLSCSCQNCLDDIAAGRSFTAAQAQALLDDLETIRELPERARET